MMIDFRQVLKEFDGSDLKGSTGEILTLRKVALAGLNFEDRDDHGRSTMTLEDKYRQGRLAVVLASLGENAVLEVTAPEVVMIRDQIGKVWPPYVTAQALDILDGHIIVWPPSPEAQGQVTGNDASQG